MLCPKAMQALQRKPLTKFYSGDSCRVFIFIALLGELWGLMTIIGFEPSLPLPGTSAGWDQCRSLMALKCSHIIFGDFRKANAALAHALAHLLMSLNINKWVSVSSVSTVFLKLHYR